MENEFWPAQKTSDHLFRVRALADRYELLHLRALAELQLEATLCAENVLHYLGRISGSGGSLERACWSLMAESGRDILHANAASLATLASENPTLAQTIMLRACDFGG